ncbi:CocE/NonD family hydrolase, partial [Nakamurella sp.]|uniref:CocE/NonD family hydrolase n=1 Tax=Nakamurella sp. TaxID=1869182 RepID=UPI003B3A18F5
MGTRIESAGTGPGERRLNGPQTTGRDYRELSEPRYRMTTDEDVEIRVRDGSRLYADVHHPDDGGRFPALVAASPYPRQIQNLGAPLGFIEAGASDFFVPRGYVHVIVNLRSTGGSDGTFGFFDGQERRDLHDVVEWAAAQPWCDGTVGMIGISYFAMAQLEAAVEKPPHLKAIFPLAVTPDLYDAAYHHGLLSSSFDAPFVTAMGVTSGRSDAFWRGRLLAAVRHVLNEPRIHARLAHMNGEAAVTGLKKVMRLHYDPVPWDRLFQQIAIEHQVRDGFWDDRNVLPLLAQVDIPVYLGCDWQNVPLHLPGTFTAWEALRHNPNVRMGMLGEFGLTWPWESLHVEALAWFDHWLKGRDTGIMDGPAVRYLLPGQDEWRTADAWPPPAEHRAFALAADGTLSGDPDSPDSAASRRYLCEGAGLNRMPNANPFPLPGLLAWDTDPLAHDTDVVGDIELRLHASSTASDTAWIVVLQDVDEAGEAVDVTAGFLRAALRAVDEPNSRPGAPALPCRHPEAVPAGERVEYRIPLVPNARRFRAGHRIRLVLTSDDQPDDRPAIMNFRHTPVGTSAVNEIFADSRLL